MVKYCPLFSKLVRYQIQRNLVCPKDGILRKRSKRETELMLGNSRNVSFAMMVEEKAQVMELPELQIMVELLINESKFNSINIFFKSFNLKFLKKEI
jgi:hypothetical protein